MTPYETKLRTVSVDAHAAVDFANAKLIIEMIRQVQVGRYPDLQGTFALLGAPWRTRLGTPPANRAEDVGAAPGSPPAGA